MKNIALEHCSSGNKPRGDYEQVTVKDSGQRKDKTL